MKPGALLAEEDWSPLCSEDGQRGPGEKRRENREPSSGPHEIDHALQNESGGTSIAPQGPLIQSRTPAAHHPTSRGWFLSLELRPTTRQGTASTMTVPGSAPFAEVQEARWQRCRLSTEAAEVLLGV